MKYVVSLLGVLLSVVACKSDPAPMPDGPDPVSILPASYTATFTEVRACRGPSTEHNQKYVRVLADPAAMGPYVTRASEFPVGSVVVKEEYGENDATCAGPIVDWTVMSRLATGSSPATIDWRWQRIIEATGHVQEDLPGNCETSGVPCNCVGCHTMCGVYDAADPNNHGYLGTCEVP